MPTSRVPARSGIMAAARSSWCKTRRAAPNSQLCRAEVSPHFLRMCFQPLAAQRLCAQAAALLPVRTRCAPGAVERCRVLSCASNAGSRRRSPRVLLRCHALPLHSSTRVRFRNYRFLCCICERLVSPSGGLALSLVSSWAVLARGRCSKRIADETRGRTAHVGYLPCAFLKRCLCFNLRLQQLLIQLLHRGRYANSADWPTNVSSLRCCAH